MTLVVSEKRLVVKTKQFSWFLWFIKKVWWLKQNKFQDFGAYSKKKVWWQKPNRFHDFGGKPKKYGG